MLYILSLIAGIGIVILIELCLQAITRQQAEGKNVSFLGTFLTYLIFVLIISGIVFLVARSFGLG